MRRISLAIGIGVLGCAALAAFLFFGKPESVPSTEVPDGRPVVGAADTEDSYDVLVSFDGERFSPNETTIPIGTRVRFLNASDTDVWPASAVHPTHSLYPEKDTANCLGSSFDSCRRLGKGEFFDFTFNYAGEWRYHDHVKAYKTGVVMVIE